MFQLQSEINAISTVVFQLQSEINAMKTALEEDKANSQKLVSISIYKQY